MNTAADPATSGWKKDMLSLTGTSVTTSGGQSFVLKGLLGRGGMAVVYEAEGDWAVKILTEDRWHEHEFQARFVREVRVGCVVSHANVVKILDWGLLNVGSDSVRPFIVMEKLSGSTLRERMRQGPMPPEQVVPIVVEILKALKAVHSHGVIHRDMKPDNVMLLRSGHLKIMDFGVAKDISAESLTVTRGVLGTPQYMSPEHLNSKTLVPSSDVYSVGVMAYEMLTGQSPYPYESDNMWALLGHILQGDAPHVRTFLPTLNPALADVVMRMMALAPADRYASADDALQALLVV